MKNVAMSVLVPGFWFTREGFHSCCLLVCLGMEVVGHRRCLCSPSGYTAKVVAPVYTPYVSFCCSISLAILGIAVVLILSNLIGVW